MYRSEICFYGGSEEEWKQISIGSDNQNLLNAVVYYDYGSDSNSSIGLDVTYHTQKEIIQFVKNHPVCGRTVTYDEEPSLSVPYKPGKLSDISKRMGINAINIARYIAGLDANVVINDYYEELAQTGALVNAVNNELSHTPDKPANMDQSQYETGFAGTSSSNLGWGYGNLASAVLEGWVNDDGGNRVVVGHRRWVLNPPMGATGFGFVDYYSAMYCFDGSNAARNCIVAWPAQNMPVEIFGESWPWSISIGYYVDPDAVHVTLVRQSDNKKWKFSTSEADGFFNVDNDGYGQTGCIIFEPYDTGWYSSGDHYDVEIAIEE